MTTTETQIHSEIMIRRMDLADRDLGALAALADRDTHAHLEGPVLGVEVEGTLLAAISVNTGEMIADPFSRTSELRALLKLRVAQLEDRRRANRYASRIFGRPARPAVGGSPAGQIISLPRVL